MLFLTVLQMQTWRNKNIRQLRSDHHSPHVHSNIYNSVLDNSEYFRLPVKTGRGWPTASNHPGSLTALPPPYIPFNRKEAKRVRCAGNFDRRGGIRWGPRMTVDIGTSFNQVLPRHYQATVSKYLDGQHKMG
jgi:hypothetical protein